MFRKPTFELPPDGRPESEREEERRQHVQRAVEILKPMVTHGIRSEVGSLIQVEYIEELVDDVPDPSAAAAAGQ